MTLTATILIAGGTSDSASQNTLTNRSPGVTSDTHRLYVGFTTAQGDLPIRIGPPRGGYPQAYLRKTQAGNGTSLRTIWHLWIVSAGGGTFYLTFDAAPSGDIAWNAATSAIQDEFTALLTTATVTGSGTAGAPWIITVTADFADHDLTVVDTGLLGVCDGLTISAPVEGGTVSAFLTLDAGGLIAARSFGGLDVIDGMPLIDGKDTAYTLDGAA